MITKCVCTAVVLVLSLSGAFALGTSDDESADALFSQGVELLKGGKCDEATQAFTMAIALAPDTAEYYFWRGKAYYWCYEGAKSEEDYLEAVHLDPNNPKYYAELGLIYSSKGDNGKSIHYYETALELKPDFYPAMRNLCNTYVDAGLYSEAVSLLNRLTELAVENGHLKSDRDFIYRKFVEAYHGLGDKEKENYYQRLLQDQGE